MNLSIRAIKSSDFAEVKKIHERFYKDDFEMPNFIDNFISAFVVEDESGIVTACGIRKIAEIIALTNKDKSTRTRRASLLIGQEALSFIAGRENFNQLHAFTNDQVWINHLRKAGFISCKGEALVLHV